MKYFLLLFVLALAGCGDVNITTTSSGGDSGEPVVVEPEVVIVEN